MNTICIIFGIAAIIAGIAMPIVLANSYRDNRYDDAPKKIKKAPWIALICVGLALFILGNAFVMIPSGHTGVRTVFGQIDETPCTNGLNWKIPFVEHIVDVNNKQTDKAFASGSGKDDRIWGEASDKTPVYAADVVVSYNVAPEKSAYLHANFNNANKVENLIDEKIVASAVKAAMVAQPVESVTNRAHIEPAVVNALQIAVNEKYGDGVINISKVVINDMDFEDEYNEAIQKRSLEQQKMQTQAIANQAAIEKAEADKQVAIAQANAAAEAKRLAAQADADARRIAAETDAETKRIAAETDAETKLIQAQADADALIIKGKSEGDAQKAIAEGKAEAYRLMGQYLNDDLLAKIFYERWNGQLPTIYGVDGAMLDLRSMVTPN